VERQFFGGKEERVGMHPASSGAPPPRVAKKNLHSLTFPSSAGLERLCESGWAALQQGFHKDSNALTCLHMLFQQGAGKLPMAAILSSPALRDEEASAVLP
jgi:hypothetical protein